MVTIRASRWVPALLSSRQYPIAWRTGQNIAAQVHPDDRVPLLDRHVDEHPVADDAGVAHHGVETAEGVDRLRDEAAGAVPVADVVAVDDGLAAGRDDLVDDLLAGRLVGGVTGRATPRGR